MARHFVNDGHSKTRPPPAGQCQVQTGTGCSTASPATASCFVERSTDGTTWSHLSQKSANVTSHVDANLKRNVRYYYRVRAFNAAGSSEYSNVASTVTGSSAATPQLATGASGASAHLDTLLQPEKHLFSNRVIDSLPDEADELRMQTKE